MEPQLYYNITRGPVDDDEHSFYILVSEMPDKMLTSQVDCASVWGAVEENIGSSNVTDGVWGKDSVNVVKIKEIMEQLDVERSKELKLKGHRTI